MQFQTLLFLHSYKSFGCTKKNEGQMYVCNGLTKVSAIQTILKIGKKNYESFYPVGMSAYKKCVTQRCATMANGPPKSKAAWLVL